MRIKDVEKLIGIRSKNIRFYEKEGLLYPQRNLENGYREYYKEDIEQLKLIKLFRKLGVSVEDIKKLLFEKDLLGDILAKQVEFYDAEINNLIESKLLCQRLLKQGLKFDEINSDNWLSEMDNLERRGVRFMNINNDEILRYLPDKYKLPYYEAIIKNGEVNSELLEEIFSYIEEIYRKKVDTEELLIDAFKKVNPEEREELLNIMKENNQELYQKMSQGIYNFEDIIKLNCEKVKIVLSEFAPRVIVMSAMGASPMVNEYLQSIFQDINFSELRVGIGRIPLADVVNAQEELMNAINDSLNFQG